MISVAAIFIFISAVYLQSCVLALLFLFVLNAIYLLYSQYRANFIISFKINGLFILLLASVRFVTVNVLPEVMFIRNKGN